MGRLPGLPWTVRPGQAASGTFSQFEVEYLFPWPVSQDRLDGVYESLRRLAGVKECVLVAWGICRDGRKVLLHIALGSKESYGAWQGFIRDMQQRGLRSELGLLPLSSSGEALERAALMSRAAHLQEISDLTLSRR